LIANRELKRALLNDEDFIFLQVHVQGRAITGRRLHVADEDLAAGVFCRKQSTDAVAECAPQGAFAGTHDLGLRLQKSGFFLLYDQHWFDNADRCDNSLRSNSLRCHVL
jgi:hypothetical protein